MSTLKKDWTPEVTLSQLLLVLKINQTIKCLLIYPNPESALNEEAGRLLLEEYDNYFKHAKLITSVHAMKNKIEFKVSSSEIKDDHCIDRDVNAGGILTPVGSKGNISPTKRTMESIDSKKAATKERSKKSVRRL